MSIHRKNVSCTICTSSYVREIISLPDNKKVMICKNCKNAFTHPKPALPDYSSEDFQAKGKETDILTNLKDLPHEIEKSYTLQLEMINKHLPKGSPILEIGGGEGIFLNMLKNNGYDVELVEPSLTASTRARKRGLHVHADYIQNLHFDKKFALICMSHVLEHIDEPVAAIDYIKTFLAPDGFILLAQTNFRGFMPFLLKENWYAWVPDQHFSHFSLAGLKYIAKQCSMSLSEYRYSRLVHGPSLYHTTIKYVPFLQDQLHVLLEQKSRQ